MCAIINKIVKQASHTFRFGSSNPCGSHLEKLIRLTKSLKATDVGLSPNGDDIALASALYEQDLLAPVCHINLLKTEQFSFGIFIIRKGMALPLHDHPGMTGIVKVLYGTLKVTSYKAKDGPLSMEEHSTLNRIPVTRLPDVTLTSSSDCQVLTPHVGNFHFVQSMGDDTAIFDILAPPYSDSDNRDCHYYKEMYLSTENDCFGSELRVDDRNLQPYLIRVDQPYDFYCDQIPYVGPSIEIDYEDDET